MNRCRLLMASILILAVAGFAGAATQDISAGPSKSFEASTGEFDRAEHFRRMTQIQRQLAGSMVDLALGLPLDVTVTLEERLSVIDGDSTAAQKMKVGLVKELDFKIVFDRHALLPGRSRLHETLGAVRGGVRGGFHWSARVRASEAAALRIHFTDFDLPEGAKMYVYTLDGVAFGPYTGKGPNGTGEFWTNTVPGSDMMVQLHAGFSGDPAFRIAGIGYMTSEFEIASSIAPPSEVSASVKNCSFNASCVEGAGCSSSGAVSVAEDAVAHILFASGRFLYICSGGLVADSDTSTSIPYFITANHCISKGGEASSMETFFLYKSSCGQCPPPGSASTTGSSIVASNRTSDYTLLRLSQNAPTGTAFLGWESNPVANSNETALYRISHPQGAPQSYSEHEVDTSKPTCQSWPRGNWIYSRDTLGATEGGSSGSPVVNGAGKLVGQLSGACGFNVNDECDADSNATVDGAFAAYYSSVSSILGSGDGGGGDPDPDPDPTCTDNDGDGWCVEDGDCNDSDSSINPGRHEKGKFGRDGKDNDCNGIIDG